MNMLKRFLSLALAIVMVLACVPSVAFAEENAQGSEAVIELESATGEKTVYTELYAALMAVQDGDTIRLLQDVEMPETIVNTQTVILDLNGHTVTGTPTEAAAYSVILNQGTMTITDSGENGAIVCNHTLAGSTAYAVNTITNCGTLTVEGGTIRNTSTAANQIGYAIDNNSTSNAAILTVAGGVIEASGSNYYDGIRQFCNSQTVANTVTVTGGKISSIWTQNPSDGSADRNTKPVLGTVKISNGEIGALYLEPSAAFEVAVTGGTVNTVGIFDLEENDAANVPSGFIYGGTFKTPLEEAWCASNCGIQDNGDGTYTVSVQLPTATITTIANPDLTFAMNFKADAVSDEQMTTYGGWYADFVLTSNKDIVLNNDDSADGWLAGQYDAWSQNWVTVPFGKFAPATIKADEELRIMEYAAKVLGEEGLQFTYADIYNEVKDFDCGMYLDPEFLAANPDLKITLELRMYNPDNQEESVAISDTYEFTIPNELPTATVTPISNKDLTFALNFKADEATVSQLSYYGSWYADFVLTSNKDMTLNAEGGADGYLSGQYDAWSENWVNVPFGKYAPATLKAGESLKIMEYAAELMGEPGLKYTYKEVYDVVKDFDCGMYLTPEFLAANPDLEVTLELRMYNPKDESESVAISDLYVFTLPALPTATTTTIDNEELTFAMNFKADEATVSQLSYYGSWYADFVLTTNKDMTLDAEGGADGWLSGQYDEWSENWVNVPFGKYAPVTLKAGESLKIMEFAAELMGEPGLKYTYLEVYNDVKDFDCGMYLTPEFLAANPDLEVTLELRVYNPLDESTNYLIGDTYVFTLDQYVAHNTTTDKYYTTVNGAMLEAAAGETVEVIRDCADRVITIQEETVLNLNGFTVTTDYVACYGDLVDYTEDNSGLLIVDKTRFFIRDDNAQLPVRDGEGYRLVEVIKFNQAMMSTTKYAFQPMFEESAHALLLNGTAATGVTIRVFVSWKQGEDVRTQEFVFSDEHLAGFIESYKPDSGKYSMMFTLTLRDAEDFEDLTFVAAVVSEVGVTFSAA